MNINKFSSNIGFDSVSGNSISMLVDSLNEWLSNNPDKFVLGVEYIFNTEGLIEYHKALIVYRKG